MVRFSKRKSKRRLLESNLQQIIYVNSQKLARLDRNVFKVYIFTLYEIEPYFIFYKLARRFSMQAQDQPITQWIKKHQFCLLPDLLKMNPNLNEKDITRSFVHIYRSKELDVDLFCHIFMEKQNQKRINMERYSHIQKGFILDKIDPKNIIHFEKSNIKEFKILGIFYNSLPLQHIINSFNLSMRPKKQKYINKFVALPNISLLTHPSALKEISKDKQVQKKPEVVKNVSKKQENNKKQENKVLVQKKSMNKPQNIPKPKQQKAKIMPNKQQKKPISTMPPPLIKTSSKEVKQNPIMTTYTIERQKLQAQKLQSQKRQMLKLLNQDQSSEEYYHANKKVFDKMMDIQEQNGKHTDTSGKKNDDQNEPMDIQVDPMKQNNDDKKFIVSDQDQSDQDIFQKMSQVKKKSQSSSIITKKIVQSVTQQKKIPEKSMQNAMKPKVPLIKTQSKEKMGVNKGSNSLLNYFKAKSSD